MLKNDKRAIFTASLLLAIMTDASLAETPNLGKPIDEAAIAAWDISILPDGTGLPKGNGTPAQGAVIYADKCASCHGDNAKGGLAAALVSDREIAGISAAQKTIKNFWPYSTTIFDFIRRAMPFQAPRGEREKPSRSAASCGMPSRPLRPTPASTCSTSARKGKASCM